MLAIGKLADGFFDNERLLSPMDICNTKGDGALLISPTLYKLTYDLTCSIVKP